MENQQQSESLESREVRGVTFKLMMTIVGVIVSSTVAIIMTINGLRTDILKIQSVQDKQSEVFDLKLRTLDIRVTNIEGEQKDQNDRIQKNEEKLNDVKRGGARD